ncbi:hypothetical protein CHS0354_003495 [Potamilus streckersoni]|uniref:Uncharacterized protein n=1 Tax=Potamilus streckersoni TaxID=2493646 RepID=A0AAE0SZ55_9BIVA|nr:hypothetical protein CHS0354_003495 [Potamilus streckersoni]
MVSSLWPSIGFFLACVALVLMITGFATPNWVESEPNAISLTKLTKVGLWEFCFYQYSDDRGQQFGYTFTGCFWLFDRRYNPIRDYIAPGWFKTTQALVTTSIVIAFITTLFVLLALITCVPRNKQKWLYAVITILQYFVGALLISAMILFGTNAATNRAWLNYPERRLLGWSYYLCCTSTGIILLAGMCFTVHYLQIRKEIYAAVTYRSYEMTRRNMRGINY